MLQLFPQKVKSVFCRMHKDFPNAPKIDSHVIIILEFENGCTGVIDASSTTTIPKPRFYVVGSNATFAKFGGL